MSKRSAQRNRWKRKEFNKKYPIKVIVNGREIGRVTSITSNENNKSSLITEQVTIHFSNVKVYRDNLLQAFGYK